MVSWALSVLGIAPSKNPIKSNDSHILQKKTQWFLQDFACARRGVGNQVRSGGHERSFESVPTAAVPVPAVESRFFCGPGQVRETIVKQT